MTRNRKDRKDTKDMKEKILEFKEKLTLEDGSLIHTECNKTRRKAPSKSSAPNSDVIYALFQSAEIQCDQVWRLQTLAAPALCLSTVCTRHYKFGTTAHLTDLHTLGNIYELQKDAMSSWEPAISKNTRNQPSLNEFHSWRLSITKREFSFSWICFREVCPFKYS